MRKKMLATILTLSIAAGTILCPTDANHLWAAEIVENESTENVENGSEIEEEEVLENLMSTEQEEVEVLETEISEVQENTIETEVSVMETETVEAEESEEVQEVSEDIKSTSGAEILYSGKDGDIDWSIDTNGLLTLSGTGDWSKWLEPEWTEHNTDITSAVVNITGITNASGIFYDCSNLTTLDLSNFDTSKVTEMYGMFSGCSSLTTLDLSNFDTSNVTRMGSMFRGCSSLTTLDLSNFDTSNVTEMGSMFRGCSSLTTLDLSNFDISVVWDMERMFESCSSLTTLDLSNFGTTKVKDMSNMFYKCSSLTTLDLSNFNTSSKETWMNSMFSGCSSLTTLDLSNFDTSNATWMGSMFSDCSSLTTLDLSSFDTSNVTSMSGMFRNCSSLTTLDLSNFDTSNVTEMSGMFRNCSSLTALDLSSFDTSNVEYMGNEYSRCGMFSGCSSLTTLDLSNFDTSSAVDMSYMFFSCVNLEKIIFGPRFEFWLGFSEYTQRPVRAYVCGMFHQCFKLKDIEVDENNPNFASIDGVLYSKDLSVLNAYPQAQVKVIIPQSVTSIADDVFSYYLTDVYYGGSEAQWKNILIGDDNGTLKQATVHYNYVRGCEHTSTRLENKVSATCTKDGYSGDKICNDCGTVLEKGTVIPATGHKEVIDKGVEATCTTAGKTEGSHCSVCGEVIKAQEVIPATGHDFGDEQVIEKASPGKDGSYGRICSKCGAVEKEIIYAPEELVLSDNSYTYNEKKRKPSVIVTDTEGETIPDTDYTVSYGDNKNVGVATVTVEFKGNYSGSLKTSFTIAPKTVAAAPSLSAKSKSIVVKWKKQTVQTSGYQIQYSTSSKFTDKTSKTITVKSNKTTSKTISKLKTKKKYYVRVRTYKTVKINGKSTKIYSDWSKTKSVKTKK